ncbi:hypothetical protein LTR28_008094 [Elasticomyces elasticus]|nr:hypothetical protein LTR28_008094 [Elasticomyces elasticus]
MACRCLARRIQLLNPQRRSYTRPPNAPKPAIDLKHIRQNPGLYEQNCIDRNYKHQARNSWRILELHEQWQEQQQQGRSLREQNNHLRRQLADAASRSGDAEGGTKSTDKKDSLLEEAKVLKERIGQIEGREAAIQLEIESLALELPNLSSQHTPNGEEPEVIGYINEMPSSNHTPRSHVDIGAQLELLDFASAATTSGWGYYFLLNEAALLEQALIQYSLSMALARRWKVVSPPSTVYSHIAAACGFQPRDQHGEQQVYAIEQAEKDKAKPALSLAGTAEIPLAGMKVNSILEETNLPLKVIGASRCYRAEAGARGVDTKGLYRVHEFTKVEMFGWTMPPLSQSTAHGSFGDADTAKPPSTVLFEEMVEMQKDILGSLGLHCRILEMPSTDLGASASRKIDIEAFFPSRLEHSGGWGEVTSASICTDYQSRRLGTRARTARSGGKGGLEWPHTVNGTAIAVPRVLAAIMENGWDEPTQTLAIPTVLRPWMGGIERVKKG